MRPRQLARREIWWILLALGLTVLAGGGNPVWARALVLIAVGVWLFLRPPVETPSRLLEIALGLFLAVGVVATFLPAAWLGAASWRRSMEVLGAQLPATNATSPWLGADALAQLLAGLAWFYLCWNLRFNHEARKRAIWGLAILAAALAAGAMCGNLLKLKYPLGEEAMNFSYFPNRNQSALWYCIGGLLAFGLLVDSLQRKRGHFFLASGLLVPCVIAVVMGRSRMALALFAFGLVVVVLVRQGRSAGKLLLRVVLPVGLLALAALLRFADHDTLDRIPLLGSGGDVQDFRIQLWHDTVDMAKLQPAGVGLGQFAEVFPQYREHALSYQTVRHPDSDWVWLLGETGWAGLALAALAAGAVLAVFSGKRWSSCGPYRHLALICAGTFFLHSLVDVPGHRWGTWLLLGFLLGIAVPDGEAFPPVKSWVPRWMWRGGGVLTTLLGLCWLAAYAGLPANAGLAEQRAQALASGALKGGNANSAWFFSTQAADIAPMQWQPYFLRANAELTLAHNPDVALNDFRLARLVEPTWSRVPYSEGLLWEPTDHARAFAAWREAIHRDDATPEGLWRNIYDHLKLWPDGEDYASVLSKAQPLFRWEFLTKEVSNARFPAEMTDELRSDPDLSIYDAMQKKDLLERWAALDGNAALAFIHAHAQIIPTVWIIEARVLAANGQTQEALDLVRKHLPPQPLPQFTFAGSDDLESLRASFTSNPDSLRVGTELARLQLQAGDYDDAAGTLAKMASWPEVPSFVNWNLAEVLTQTGKFNEAWVALQPCLKAQENLPVTGR